MGKLLYEDKKGNKLLQLDSGKSIMGKDRNGNSLDAEAIKALADQAGIKLPKDLTPQAAADDPVSKGLKQLDQMY